ncbi:F-box/LRR-repeat protein At3g26922 isoform X2 [Ziziphus jujuba]|uniref:F-box/LRR-repeat protein At3g26922 isoform X2 n=1 Tax=Ziziphus jujuba TaxID=326968 RepID=A0A6P3ZF37_ZIZJJ|nr:F-box/LRR-repeat protein At3g26922 isoform X2 [Ziziphus jujuba]
MMENPLQRCRSQNKKKKRDGYNPGCDEYNRDRISELPEEILGRIVCGLPLKEAAATSILSKRWRWIWTLNKNLDFDAHQTLNRILDSKNYAKLLKHERRKYIDKVNSVITQRSKTNNMVVGIDRFRIDFDLSRKHSSSIDSWIDFAMKNRVHILELELFELGGIRVIYDCYILRKEQFDPIALNSLKVLNLACVDISGKVVEWLLSNCPLLERLKIVASTKLIKLRILGGPLKHLEISRCIDLKTLKIHDAQNLVSLYSLSNSSYKFRLRNVPKLVHLFINANFGLEGQQLGSTFTLLSSCLSQLQILHLNLSIQTHLRNLEYPMLINLKQLKLTVNPKENLNLLRSRITYFLKMLFLDYFLDEMCEFIIEPANWPLEEVEILGYSGTPNEDQLIIYFAENLVALQKIIVHPSAFRNYNPPFKRIKNSKTIRKEEKIRDHAVQHIKGKIPTAVELEFVLPLIYS